MITNEYKLSMTPQFKQPVVWVSQYDTGGRTLKFNLYANGAPLSIPSGITAVINGVKPDGTVYSYPMAVGDDYVQIELQEQMTAVAGAVTADIVLTGTGGNIGTANFTMMVERSPLDEGVISESEIAELQQILNEAQEAARKAQALAINVTAGPSNPLTITDGADNMPVKDLTVSIEPYQSGSGDPSPTNVRPISGWTNCEIQQTNGTTSRTYTVSFSSAGTVYGGTLDVTTGVLTADRTIVDLGELSWSYDSANLRFSTRITDLKTGYSTRKVPFVCSSLLAISDGRPIGNVPDKSIYGAGASNYTYAVDHSYTNASAFTAAMSGAQLVYPIATPVTYQLTPTEVTTLLKDNTFTANCGAVSLTYFADTQTFITEITTPISDMIAPTEAEYKATRAYTANDLLIVDGKLYKATTSIANGATITPNTNVTQTTLSALIKALS